MRREARRPYHHRVPRVGPRGRGPLGQRGRYWGKSVARASTPTSRRQKAASVRARMQQCLEYLGDPRVSMTLEEKKKLALFYFFSQVPLYKGNTYIEFEHCRGSRADPELSPQR